MPIHIDTEQSSTVSSQERVENASPREYLKLKYMGDCKCGNCQLVPPEMLETWADEISTMRAALAACVQRLSNSDQFMDRHGGAILAARKALTKGTS